MVIGQELGVRRWNLEGRVVDFKKHLKETQRGNQLQIKVQWSNHTEAEATWEREDYLRSEFPYLF